MVTDGGTPNWRQPACAPGTAAAMNCADVNDTEDVGAGLPGHMVSVGVTTYACETYVPLVVRSHWVVDRTVPLTWPPTTPQTSLTVAPLASEPTRAEEML